jgi:ferredoxin
MMRLPNLFFGTKTLLAGFSEIYLQRPSQSLIAKAIILPVNYRSLFLRGHKSSAQSVGQYKVKFITSDGETCNVFADEDESILDVAHNNDIELEGACEGSLACSTCHVVVDPTYYDRIPEPTDEENDMLDLAFGLTDT